MTDSVYKGEDFDQKVKQQVEFYFSDSNLQTDRFLWKIYEANDGWVELKTLLTFGRMRQYRPEEKVVAALKTSEKLVLSANDDMVRRKDPLKDFNELKNIRKKNSVHIEGFPKDLEQEVLEKWFSEKILAHLPKEQAVSSIRRIRTRATKEFFGVVDVEFKTFEDSEHFLNNLTVSYPQGVVHGSDESMDKKDILKKMSLLTFREMKESGKRFGVNDVTKRRSSFNSNRNGKKFKKGSKKDDSELAISEDKDDKETEKKETEKTEPEAEKKEAEAEKPETASKEA